MTDLTDLSRVPLFEGLAEYEVAEISRLLRRRTYSAGSMVFQEGQTGRRLYIVESGQVRICRVNEDGDEITVAVCSDGEVFGEMALVDGGPRSATVMTMTRTNLLMLHRDDFMQYLQTRQEVALKIIGVLSERLRTTTARTGELAFLDVQQRLSSALLSLSRRHGVESEEGVAIDLRLTQGDLAGLLGASRESVNRALAALRGKGLVRQSGRRVIIVDRDALRRERF